MAEEGNSNKAAMAVKLGVAVAAIGVLGYFMYRTVFPPASADESAGKEDVVLTVPDAIVDRDTTSRLKSLTSSSSERDYAAQYWNSLGSGDEGAALKGDPFAQPAAGVNADDLDPAVYSSVERLQIKNGLYTKEEIDLRHAERAREAEEEARREAEERSRARREEYEMSDRYQDSVADARMRRTMELMKKYSEPQAVPADTAPSERRYAKIDVPSKEAAYIPTESLQDDGIISSITPPSSDGATVDGKAIAKMTPAKATFLRSEKIVSGQRVVLRLLQPLVLSSGDVIPANTHVTGLCSVTGRLEIDVSTVQYAGKLYRANLTAYDNDGTEGIYCPVTQKKRSKGGRVVSQGVSQLSSMATALFTGNSELGSIASSGLDEMTSEIGRDGSVSINIKAGYEFYVYEKPDEHK